MHHGFAHQCPTSKQTVHDRQEFPVIEECSSEQVFNSCLKQGSGVEEYKFPKQMY